MARQRIIRTSEYKNVSRFKGLLRGKDSQHLFWKAQITRDGKNVLNRLFDTEKGAAKAVDWTLINIGEDAVNGFYTPVNKKQ